MRIQPAAVVLFVLAALAEEAQAQSPFELKPVATSIEFVARRFGVATATGRFASYEGAVVLDFDHAERSRIRVKIDTASLTTGVAMVDTFIKGDSMLDVAHHPSASFVSTEVTRTGPRSLSISGQLTIRSVTRPIVATAIADSDPVSGRTGAPLPFHATASFSRSAFDIGHDVNIVDDQVEIDIKGRVDR